MMGVDVYNRTEYKRPHLGEKVWGLSFRWFAVCPWNGDSAWIQLPLVYFAVGTRNVELGLGTGPAYLCFDVRWRW